MLLPKEEQESVKAAIENVSNYLNDSVPAFIVQPKHAIQYIDQVLKPLVIKGLRDSGDRVDVKEIRLINKVFKVATRVFIKEHFQRRWTVIDYFIQRIVFEFF